MMVVASRQGPATLAPNSIRIQHLQQLQQLNSLNKPQEVVVAAVVAAATGLGDQLGMVHTVRIEEGHPTATMITARVKSPSPNQT